jgi:hypothetical protein
MKKNNIKFKDHPRVKRALESRAIILRFANSSFYQSDLKKLVLEHEKNVELLKESYINKMKDLGVEITEEFFNL